MCCGLHCSSCIVGAVQSARHVGKCWIRDSVTTVCISLVILRPVDCALRTDENLTVESAQGGGTIHSQEICVRVVCVCDARNGHCRNRKEEKMWRSPS
jgi:hypothetical protein